MFLFALIVFHPTFINKTVGNKTSMEDEKGYFIYKDRMNAEKYDHPKFSAIFAHLKVEFTSYKYTVYRCAMKIVALRKVFYTHNIPYSLVLSILERHNLGQTGCSTPVYPAKLTAVLHDAFFACEKLGHISDFSSYQLNEAVEVLSNFIWNVYDPQRAAPVSLFDFKTTLLILCEVNNFDLMVSEFFNLTADYNRCVSRFRLERLLTSFTKILCYIGEAGSYGAQNITSIIDQCFAQCPGINGISELIFNNLWTISQTKFLIYGNLFALAKRIKNAEKLVHNNECTSCLTPNIVGIRFKCKTCRNFSLCLKCFSVGFEKGKHTSSHCMQEVFSEDVVSKKWSHFISKLCNKFIFECNTHNVDSVKESEHSKVADVTVIEKDEKRTDNENVNHSKASEFKFSTVCYSETENSIQCRRSFQAIIKRLSEEKEKIEKQWIIYESKKFEDQRICQFLKSHKDILSTILEQLQHISQNAKLVSYPTSSTPNRNCDKLYSELETSNLSKSINGADINKSYLEANKSNYSLSDLSTWYHQRREIRKSMAQPIVQDCEDRDTQMDNFRKLLLTVRDIIDDAHSDNIQLAEATSHLEAFLDCVIEEEESKRHISKLEEGVCRESEA